MFNLTFNLFSFSAQASLGQVLTAWGTDIIHVNCKFWITNSSTSGFSGFKNCNNQAATSRNAFVGGHVGSNKRLMLAHFEKKHQFECEEWAQETLKSMTLS